MQVCIFTSNHPRHLALIKVISLISDQVFVIQEAKTMFQGIRPGMFRGSPVIRKYFQEVSKTELKIFGGIDYLPENTQQIALAHGDLSLIDQSILREAWNSDYFIVFGSSYIKAPMVERLVAKGAINIHMGASPYYRGNSCNFWPLFDGKPEYVGATIHLLSKGLDSGSIIFHALPETDAFDSFTLGMKAVESAQLGLAEWLTSGKIDATVPVKQDPAMELRYTRAKDFNEDIVLEFQNKRPSPSQIFKSLSNRNLDKFINPYIPQ